MINIRIYLDGIVLSFFTHYLSPFSFFPGKAQTAAVKRDAEIGVAQVTINQKTGGVNFSRIFSLLCFMNEAQKREKNLFLKKKKIIKKRTRVKVAVAKLC